MKLKEIWGREEEGDPSLVLFKHVCVLFFLIQLSLFQLHPPCVITAGLEPDLENQMEQKDWSQLMTHACIVVQPSVFNSTQFAFFWRQSEEFRGPIIDRLISDAGNAAAWVCNFYPIRQFLVAVSPYAGYYVGILVSLELRLFKAGSVSK
jgi:hypothetical protein